MRTEKNYKSKILLKKKISKKSFNNLQKAPVSARSAVFATLEDGGLVRFTGKKKGMLARKLKIPRKVFQDWRDRS